LSNVIYSCAVKAVFSDSHQVYENNLIQMTEDWQCHSSVLIYSYFILYIVPSY